MLLFAMQEQQILICPGCKQPILSNTREHIQHMAALKAWNSRDPIKYPMRKFKVPNADLKKKISTLKGQITKTKNQLTKLKEGSAQ